MNCSIIIFDACSIINLLHIDEDDMLFKEIKKHKIFIAEEVMHEVKRNANNKFRLLDTYDVSYEKDKVDEIEEKINFLIRYKITNAQIKKDCGSLLEEIKKFTKYYKYNGEFLSSCLSLIKSREENHLVNFYTDDYPATKAFQTYFGFQKIGVIQDSVDLLMYLYWTSENITLKNLKNYLSLLLYEYSIELTLLLDQIRKRKTTIQRLTKDKKIMSLLNELENALANLRFFKINKLKNEIMSFKRQIPDLCDMLNSFSKIFEVDNQGEDNLFMKIRNTSDWVNKYKIFKIN